MSRTAFLFPGQGSQRVGMGRAFYDASRAARSAFARADEVLGFPLSRLCFAGPATELRRTENAQPALFTVSLAGAALLEERGVFPGAAAGHSVGEYAALTVAGALTLEDGLRTVRRRGELMADAARPVTGAMAAVVGLPLEAVEELCTEASAHGVVEVANENAPLQTVIAGDVAAVELAMELAESRDGGVAVPLDVAGAFHTSLMASASGALAALLEEIPVRPPRIPVVANITGDHVRTPTSIREALARQLEGRVRWSRTLRRLVAGGFTEFVEVGPGRTLTRLARDVAPGVAATALEDLCRPVLGSAGGG